jgi:sarcosine oxidase subunit gamma
MPQTVEYRGPLDGSVGESLRARGADETAAAQRHLALRDLSALPKLGVKGAGAEAWLRSHGIDVPTATYDTRPIEGGGLIARLGATDFFLEGGASDTVLPHLSTELAQCPSQVYRVERQDATFVLEGVEAPKVLAQLCSIDFCSAPVGRVCLTRVGGVNCAVLPQGSDAAPVFRLWVDYTWAVAFWEILAEVSGDLGGRIVA